MRDEIRQANRSVGQETTMRLATKLKAKFPAMIKPIPHKKSVRKNIAGIKKVSPLCFTMGANVLEMTVNNLAVILSGVEMSDFNDFLIANAKTNLVDDAFLAGLASHIKGADVYTVMNLVYMAHYWVVNRDSRIADRIPIIIPNEKTCEQIIALSNNLIALMGGIGKCRYKALITQENMGFLIGDSFYIGYINLFEEDGLLAALIQREQALASPNYKNNYGDCPINHIYIVNPLDMVTYHIDCSHVDPMMIKLVKDFINGTKDSDTYNDVIPQQWASTQSKPVGDQKTNEQVPSVNKTPVTETKISPARMTYLVSMTFALVNAEDHIFARASLVNILTSSPRCSPKFPQSKLGKDNISQAVDYFSLPISHDVSISDHYAAGINILNQLLSDMENFSSSTQPKVFLSKPLAKKIFDLVMDRITAQAQ